MRKRLILLTAFIMLFTSVFISDAPIAEAASIKVNSVKEMETTLYASNIVKATWSKAPNVTGYMLYEKFGDTYDRIKILRSEDMTSYKIKNVPKGKKHVYAVRGYIKANDRLYYSRFYRLDTVYVPKVMTKKTTDYKKTTASKLIKTAESKLGCKYVMGCEGPSKFDCSGYVYYITNKAKVSSKKITRTSAACMWDNLKSYNIGSKSLSKAQPGDIVFLSSSSNSRISHVAFYYGDDQYIHATNPSDGVTVTPTRYFGQVRGIVRLPNM